MSFGQIIGITEYHDRVILGETVHLSRESNQVLMLNCDDQDDVLLLEDKSTTELKVLLSPYRYVFIDEAQRVRNIIGINNQ